MSVKKELVHAHIIRDVKTGRIRTARQLAQAIERDHAKAKRTRSNGHPVRDKLAKEFDIDSRGYIKSPGKFEAEPLYVPYYWAAAMEGLSDSDDGKVFTFVITEEDRTIFPELHGVRRLYLAESDSGFVYSSHRKSR